ncbi:MAG: hypothetical protein ACYTF0_06115 [Planctomycetota bacterium]|jgi:hypothetical protein
MQRQELIDTARDLKRRRCPVDYIRHYLMEEFQCTSQQADEVLHEAGIGNEAESGLEHLPPEPDHH